MERFYDGDPEQLYAEARVINPFRKPVNVPKKVCLRRFRYPRYVIFQHLIL